MSLHIFNQSPSSLSLFCEMLDIASEDDEILFIEDGIFFSTSSEAQKTLSQLKLPYYFLREDMEARNIQINDASAISVEQFVELTEKHTKSISWY